jgi:phage terminase large subunit GpA-like protein
VLIEIANAERIAAGVLADVWRPPPPVDYARWSRENVVFTTRDSEYPGPFNFDLFPYLREIFAALSPDDPCRVVTVVGSAQIGKTVVGNVFACASLDMDPCDVLVTHPTHDNAVRWSKTKLGPFIAATPTLRRVFVQRSRDALDSLLYKERKDGRGAILISGANSPSSLSQISMRRQVQDDLSKWETNVAGDPEVQADSRSRGFEFAKILKLSTPLVMPGCRITKSFEAGSQEYPYVPCPHCGHMQVLEWENMLAATDEKSPETAHFTCNQCNEKIEQHHRAEILRSLEWRPHNERARREHRSFYIWSAYTCLQSWERIYREWLRARGDTDSEKTFLNDTCGKAFRAASEAPPWEGLRDRAQGSHYPICTVPGGALLLFAGIDCQIDRVECQVVGFGREFRRYVIDYRILPGHITEERCQELLDAFLAQKYKTETGGEMGLSLTAIDGGAWTEDVWDWARRHPKDRVIMVRGANQDTAPRLARVRRERNEKTGKLLRYSSRFYNFNSSVIKMALYRDLAKDDPLSRGAVLFPRGLDDEYFRQLTSERRQPEKRHGFIVYRWVKDDSQRNEALDTWCQAEAAATKFGVRSMPDEMWAKYERAAEAPSEIDAEPVPGLGAAQTAQAEQSVSASKPPIEAGAAQPVKSASRKRKRSGFVSGWRTGI